MIDLKGADAGSIPPTSTNTPTPTGFSRGFLLPGSPGMAGFSDFPS